MENFDITTLLESFDLETAGIAIAVGLILFGLTKLPGKIKDIIVKIIDKTDEKLDEEKE